MLSLYSGRGPLRRFLARPQAYDKIEVGRGRNMLSGRLVHLIEANSASIVKRVTSQIRRDPELAHLSQLPERELQEWGEHMLVVAWPPGIGCLQGAGQKVSCKVAAPQIQDLDLDSDLNQYSAILKSFRGAV